MKILRPRLILIFLSVLTSCDCVQNVTGTVLDAQTGLPLEGALVHEENMDNPRVSTEKDGKFEIEGISGGLFGCPPMTVVISKDNYETQTVKIDNFGKATVKLKRTID